MTSEARLRPGNKEAYVWIWLEGETEPVVAGRLYEVDESPRRYFFVYGRSYLANEKAIALSAADLPLREGIHEPGGMSLMPPCLRDAGPDAWGRRILENRYSESYLSELDYLLLAGSDRIGALDFQTSSQEFVEKGAKAATLDELARAADLVDRREPLHPELETALLQGTSVGGARPKALLTDGEKFFIAKFGSTSDTYDVIKAEYLGMKLAAQCGLDVAAVDITQALGKDVLLVERFDRETRDGQARRRMMESALSLLLLDEMEARHASYLDLADLVRHRFADPAETLRALFGRLAFNVLIGNTDDHARNHAAFWDGSLLRLTPAYDICPQPRTGGEASQAMSIEGAQGNKATLVNVRSVSERFFLSADDATRTINHMIDTIDANWSRVCRAAKITDTEAKRLRQGAVLNDYCLQGWP